MNNTELCRALFSALAQNNADEVRRLCSKDFKLIQNGAPPIDVDALIGFNGAVQNVVSNFHYANAVRSATDTGFVEEHDVCGTLPDGSSLKMRACVVGDVSEGRVVSAREYVDTAAAANLVRALS